MSQYLLNYKVGMWDSHILVLPWLVSVVLSCPCEFDSVVGQLTCDAGSQNELPFHIPDCLFGVENDQVRGSSTKNGSKGAVIRASPSYVVTQYL